MSFYDKQAWRRLRMQIVKRDGYRCVRCHTYVGGKGMARVDHIEPLSVAPHRALDPSNLRTLCPTCDNHSHSEKAGNLRGGRGARPRIDRIVHGFDERGMPRDPDHAWMVERRGGGSKKPAISAQQARGAFDSVIGDKAGP